MKSLYNSLERTFVPSPILANLLRDWGVERVESIDLGVDIEVFPPREPGANTIREELGIPDHTRNCCFMSAGWRRKKMSAPCSTRWLSCIGARRDNTICCAVGDSTLRSPAAALERGNQSGDVDSILRRCRATRIPSTGRPTSSSHPGIQETFGLVTLESQASGTPVVGIRGSYMDRIIFSNRQQWASERHAGVAGDSDREAKCGQDLEAIGLQASKPRTRANIPGKPSSAEAAVEKPLRRRHHQVQPLISKGADRWSGAGRSCARFLTRRLQAYSA